MEKIHCTIVESGFFNFSWKILSHIQSITVKKDYEKNCYKVESLQYRRGKEEKMTLSVETKYKEAMPLKTIEIIRNILSDLEIVMSEQWTNSVAGLYSVRIEMMGTNVGQNGKGTSPAYALASAYGEFMERLQNRITYNEADISSEALQYGGFYFSPDEKYLSVEEVLSEENDLIKVMMSVTTTKPAKGIHGMLENKMQEWFPAQVEGDKRVELAKKWMVGNPEGCPANFVALPYYNVCNNELTYIPYQMLRIPYGSNGTCAGNTPEEALVQGFSEVIERYIMRRIFENKLCPPNIPRTYLARYPALDAIVQEVERSGKYRVLLKDCSLGEGFPVVGAVIINQEKQSYLVRFGAHPDFSIALERCLTELLQGRDLNHDLSGMMTEFKYCENNVDLDVNFYNVLKIGMGSYPLQFFLSDSDYQFTEFQDVAGWSNKEMLAYLSGLLLEKGYTLLIRDMSYLGFPSFHVVVPGFSEIFPHSERLGVQNLREGAKKGLRNLNTASTQELNKAVSYMLRRTGYVMEGDNITRILGLPVNASFPWLKVPNYVFISAALYKMGKISEAHGMMQQFVEAMQLCKKQKFETNVGLLQHYCCVRDLLGALSQGAKVQQVGELLKNFYPEAVVKAVCALWGTPEHVFKEYGVLNCWNCPECEFKGCCAQELVKNIHIKLKQRQVANPIDQRWLSVLFANNGRNEGNEKNGTTC